MKAAFAIWNDRIAPVFDVARHAWIVERDGADGGEAIALPDGSALEKIAFLAQSGVTLLVCGAISRPGQWAAMAYGMAAIPFRAGDMATIIAAWRNDRLTDAAFAMPGCGGRGGRCRQRRGPRRRQTGRFGIVCADPETSAQERTESCHEETAVVPTEWDP